MKAPEEDRRTSGEAGEPGAGGKTGFAKTGFVVGFTDDLSGRDVLALCGGKGAGLIRMRSLGLPVPEGFVITTEACARYIEDGTLPEGLMDEVRENLAGVERATGRGFGDAENPLLVSVRSGAAVSMPGMMDTVLNLGLNDATVRGLAQSTGDERFARDSHRRFVQAFGEIVLGVPGSLFEDAIEEMKGERGAQADTDLAAEDLDELARRFRAIVAREAGAEVPDDPYEQLRLAISAVFDSWLGERAVAYRREYGIPDDLGTAVTVQRMVFGNMGETSATGVAFTRNPATGEQGIFGEFLLNAQGEDVVAGIRTPRPLREMESVLPDAYRQFLQTAERLEREYGDMQDMEFTVERDRLYMLQTRRGKRTGAAALRIARDMAGEGLISEAEAVLRVEPASLDALLHPRIDPEADLDVLARGLPASPGAATGRIVLTAQEAKSRAADGEAVLLVRRETNPDDVEGMISARGVLTALGGMTSHAAVVARGMGKPAVTGCGALKIDPTRGMIYLGGEPFEAGELLTIDGASGEVIRGEAPLVAPEPSEDFETVLRWADEARTLRVRANADTPEDARRARELGAEGIGLCRTEHMFMEGERLRIMREMILSEGEEALEEALVLLEPMQREDFEGIFRAMDGLPVTVRLLDPPLHEFLPHSKDLAKKVSDLEARGESAEEERRRLRIVEGLEEANPMLGLRGVRLGLLKPEVYLMQVRAIASAARAVREEGGDPRVEIMIPLVAFASELRTMRARIEAELAGEDIPLGTMIELPRACAVADKIASTADFFSFGTNDLTQMVCGISRDDAEEKFLADYLSGGTLSFNPFQTLDRDGVGEFVRLAIRKGKEANPALKLGVCGEHGGDPKSIAFFHEVGLDYVSCSPFRVPGARLAAAQAALGGAPV
ncbi:pyruvate, phosphate dikinase [Rubrobacter radiotolerans]|uniref:Pyruvate, phosphate dikinase n=1 Tax=Rubrobacter radiotolerans TaxID=42256 RepID=A0AB35T6J6_RUBRA|nr:pyruvate, phosphate dikinase [Rubrobacter radiotolerans]MDX5895539.1 pyruvate, phosphate dikinase [Rubrobacter radiotolerans]SMC01463.1 pyruvate phosphate dikinase [Rubrobacter radiotolerans DSM 5868]